MDTGSLEKEALACLLKMVAQLLDTSPQVHADRSDADFASECFDEAWNLADALEAPEAPDCRTTFEGYGR